jgi:hypothetical protein
VGLRAGASAFATAFDTGEQDIADARTQIESPPFTDEAATTADPVAVKRAERVDGFSHPAPSTPINHGVQVARPLPAPAKRTPEPDTFDEENLDIGEVSRVVKLTDIAKMGEPKKAQRVPLRGTGQVARLNPAEIGLVPAASNGAIAPLLDSLPGESVAITPIVATRRGTYMLIAFAAVVLLGVAGAVVLLVTSGGDDDQPMGLGHTAVIDTSRPEDNPLRRFPLPGETGSGGPGPIQRPPARRCPPYCNNYTTPGKGSTEEPTDPNLKRIEASEIEDYASKQNGGTQRCFMRAQKGVDGILVGDVKKVFVTLSIDKDGAVTDVQLSDHAADQLGKCLSGMLKHWKFRPSPGGTYKFALAFASG